MGYRRNFKSIALAKKLSIATGLIIGEVLRKRRLTNAERVGKWSES